MTDELNRKFEQEDPKIVDTDIIGTHTTGHYPADGSIEMPSPDVAKLWIEREDQAKQGMARKVDMKHAQASPSHPHEGMTNRRGIAEPKDDQ
ncbi:MAG: hypothetical protein ACM3XM_16305 [Mycobacterium leprae]